jgi:hypothetical protein
MVRRKGGEKDFSDHMSGKVGEQAFSDNADR